MSWGTNTTLLGTSLSLASPTSGSFRLLSVKVSNLLELSLHHKELAFFNIKMLCRKIPNELNQLESSLCCQKLVLSLKLIWVVFCSQRRKSSLTHMWKPPSQMAEAEQKNVFGPFSNWENHAFIPLHNQESNSLGEQSHWRREGNSISLGVRAVRKTENKFKR